MPNGESRIETVRRIYERWGKGDFSGGVELFDPYVQLILPPDFPDPGVYQGPAEIEAYMQRDFLADLEKAAIIGEEYLPAGDSVVVRVRQQATGPGSRAPVAMGYYQVWTLRGDSVLRIECMREREDALAAAGLRE